MKRPWTWWLAWGLWGAFVVLMIATVVIDEATVTPSEEGESLASDIGILVAFTAFATVGALVASRLPRNAVGWLFLASPLFGMVAAFSAEYAYHAYVADPDGLPAGALFGWLYLWTWYPALIAIGLVVLLFPDGRVPGRRWRPLLWAYVTFAVLGVGGAAIYPGLIDESWPGKPKNPLGIEELKGALDLAGGAGTLAVLVILLATLASAVVRFRRSSGDERLQLKWMLVAATLLLAHIVFTETVPVIPDAAVNMLFGLVIASIPIAAGIAMLKYRLYEIDVIISKTLVYGSLSVILGAAYVGLVLAGQWVFSAFAGGSNLAIAASTLVVAALFLPVRSRVQRFVDRRFYRRRYDAQRTLEGFGARLREQIDLGTLERDLRGVVTETMQPAHTSLWLRAEHAHEALAAGTLLRVTLGSSPTAIALGVDGRSPRARAAGGRSRCSSSGSHHRLRVPRRRGGRLLIVRRRHDNPIGWIFLGAAPCFALVGARTATPTSRCTAGRDGRSTLSRRGRELDVHPPVFVARPDRTALPERRPVSRRWRYAYGRRSSRLVIAPFGACSARAARSAYPDVENPAACPVPRGHRRDGRLGGRR